GGLDGLDRARQRGLCDPQSLRGASEMEILVDAEEVAEVPEAYRGRRARPAPACVRSSMRIAHGHRHSPQAQRGVRRGPAFWENEDPLWPPRNGGVQYPFGPPSISAASRKSPGAKRMRIRAAHPLRLRTRGRRIRLNGKRGCAAPDPPSLTRAIFTRKKSSARRSSGTKVRREKLGKRMPIHALGRSMPSGYRARNKRSLGVPLASKSIRTAQLPAGNSTRPSTRKGGRGEI